MKTVNGITIIAMDDWMVWGRNEGGVLVETCAEMWPEWLDQSEDPSDMREMDYKRAVLAILQTKRCHWSMVEENARRDARRWHRLGGAAVAQTREENEEVAFVVAGILKLECDQATLLHTLEGSL